MCSINYNLNVLFLEHNKSLETKKNELTHYLQCIPRLEKIKKFGPWDKAPETPPKNDSTF